jgi:hypothetical protein
MILSSLAALALCLQGDPQPAPAGAQEPQPPQVPAQETTQEPAPAAPEGRAQPNRTQSVLDAVQLIVNEDCITIIDLQRMAVQKGQQAGSMEDYRRLLQESAEQLTRDCLAEQGGIVLGYEQSLIDAFVRDELNEQRERYGSVAALAEELEQANFSSTQLKEDVQDRVYRQLWEGAVVGRFQGPGGRPYVDRYVRPGLMLLEFRRQGSRLDLPAKVQLEEMIIAPSLGESPEQARQKAQLVRGRLTRGEDFYELNAAYGLPGRDPELAPIDEAKLALMPEAKAFVDGAKPGDTSELIPIVRSGQLAGFRILRFVGRTEGRAASFVDREFQEEIAKTIQERRDGANKERALRALLEAAYVWPPEVGARARRRSEPAPQEPASEEPAPAPPAEPQTPPAG